MRSTSSERDVAELVRSWDEDPAELRERLVRWLWRDVDDGEFPSSALRDPHSLGWLHQYIAESDRLEAFADHTANESKHTSQTATTQLYTPRWVADWLAEQSLDACAEPRTVLDPACGGGQMLLAVADASMARGVPPEHAFTMLHGVDLDAAAVETCRESLKLAASRAIGVRDLAVEAAIGANVRTADALFADIEPADFVITNPPFMGRRSMPAALKDALENYRPFHLDLYLAFVRRCADLGREVVAILAQQTLWYLKRFEKARRAMLEGGGLTDFAHLGHGIFDALSGEKANVVAFVWSPDHDGETRFWDARDGAAALSEPPLELDVAAFDNLPASPLAFWLPKRLMTAFEERPRLSEVAEVPGSQNKTGANARYVRPADEADGEHWVPYSKGGRFAPWWGNWDWVVDWSDEARAFYASNKTSNLLAEEYWFREGLCYSDFGGKHFNARWMPPGCVFDMAGPAILVERDDRDLLAALLVVVNSTAARAMLNALNPTLHYQARDVRNLPLPRWDDASIARFAAVGHELVRVTRCLLDGGGPADELLELEAAADRVVAQAYGCPELWTGVGERRVHHRLA